MASPKDVLEELNYLTGQLTERTRFLAGGIAAFCWTGLVTRSSEIIVVLPRSILLVSLILSIFALAVDFFQYVFGYFYNSLLFLKAQRTKADEIRYNSEAFLYKIRLWCFHGKIFITIIAVLYFGGSVIRSLATATK